MEHYDKRSGDDFYSHGRPISRGASGWRQYLGDRVLFPMRRDDSDDRQAWQREPGENEYWFDWALKMPDEGVARLRSMGVLTIVSINVFQYPKHAHDELAGADIRRLIAAGIDGLQIDSIYEPYARNRP